MRNAFKYIQTCRVLVQSFEILRKFENCFFSFLNGKTSSGNRPSEPKNERIAYVFITNVAQIPHDLNVMTTIG